MRGVVLVALGIAAFLMTIAGGALAFRFRSYVGLLLSFSSGAVLGVAFFDLLPEAAALAHETQTGWPWAIAAAAGFAAYFAADRIAAAVASRFDQRVQFGPAILILHSFVDGLSIGLAFHASPTAGLVVAAGVLTHDFADGVNTYVLASTGGAKTRAAIGWLIADALAPICGIGASLLIALPTPLLANALGLFAGFFLYIGASELLPQSRVGSSSIWTALMLPLGLAAIYIATSLAESVH